MSPTQVRTISENGVWIVVTWAGNRQPIDLVLKQTINADAARSLPSVIHLTNSILTRHWWVRNHDVGSTIINQVYLELGLPTHQDVSTDLNLHITQKNTEQLRQFIATFDRFINPFCSEVPKDQLINISSGKSTSPPGRGIPSKY
ncbi:uncharacterized protein TNIN_426511 [Trichonephila inaurata madagascariensis]|uniref:Uncharacterized protein n=1 Tax=Trichonephila inaurata madagascariensis TaxID=2747483 RepID=A0A8X6XE03_9ARAC|nr:uncharacterized protein TNIN_426511 [Trichonephila inaurata madagascariensis]